MFGHNINFRINICEQNTDKQKTNGFDKILLIRKKIFTFQIKCQAKNVFLNDVKRTIRLLPLFSGQFNKEKGLK